MNSIWKYLTIGGVSRDELLERLVDSGHSVNDYARDIISKKEFTTREDLTTLKLAKVQVSELGFTNKPTSAELFSRTKQRKLGLCPAETGLHLRLAYPDQPLDEWIWVAMETIVDSNGNPNMFDVVRTTRGSWIRGRWVSPEGFWRLDEIIVFVCLD